jgi:hypothetical protein
MTKTMSEREFDLRVLAMAQKATRKNAFGDLRQILSTQEQKLRSRFRMWKLITCLSKRRPVALSVAHEPHGRRSFSGGG